jgi:heme A synthase
LGDTLFPAVSFAEGLAQELDPTSNLLLRLRVAHPAIAIGTGLVMLVVSQACTAYRATTTVKRLAWLLNGAFAAQIVLGFVNVFLLAPIPIQLGHLLLADVVWFALVCLIATTYARAEQPAELAASI